MLTTFSTYGRLQYCGLFTALVDDQAIRQGIISPRNVTPILFLFIRLGTNAQFVSWITDRHGNLVESRWLQCLNFLILEEYFCESTKRRILRFLLVQKLLQTDEHSIRSLMSRPLPKGIEALIKEFSRISNFATFF